MGAQAGLEVPASIKMTADRFTADRSQLAACSLQPEGLAWLASRLSAAIFGAEIAPRFVADFGFIAQKQKTPAGTLGCRNTGRTIT